MNQKLHFLPTLLALALLPCVQAQVLQHQEAAGTWAETITAEDLSKQLYILAADSMEGRETTKPGQRKAADYLAGQFESMGLQPINGSYFQEVPMKVTQLIGGVLSMGDRQFLFKHDFVVYPGINVADLSGAAEFVGYGIEDEKAGWNDYAGLDVKGKWVIMFSGEPEAVTEAGVDPTQASAWSKDPRVKREAAEEQGAIGVILVTDAYETMKSRLIPWLSRERIRLDVEREGEGTDLPTLLMSPESFLAMSGWKSMEAAAKKWAKRKLKGTSWPDCTLALARKDERVLTSNVWGLLPGTDSTLSQEIVVLTSHYDHIGVDKDGQINNGADDDGSGTVSLLENAEAWMAAANAGNGPRRTVMFMAFVGEEKGLLGSEWYSEHPAFPLEQHVCDLNMDMVGRFDEAHADDDRYVYLIGSDKLSSELHEISEAVNEDHIGLALDYTFNAPDDPNRFYYRSDHYNFAKHGIPVIFYFSGVHEDYHGPGDTPDKIRYPKMAEIGRLVFRTSWEVANRDGKLVVDRVNDFPTDR